jgi:IS5 family transposase
MNSISIYDQMIAIFVFIDDFLKAHASIACWRTSPNARPRFTDAEVITVALMQGVFGCQTLKQAYLLVASAFHDAFPSLCGYKEWIHRLHNVTEIVGRLIQAALCADGDALYLIDGKPIPVCKPIRHGRVRLLTEDGAYFGKSTTGWFFGFKLHVLAHISGQIVCAILTPANWSERDVALALAEAVDGGVLLADRGYRGAEIENQLAESNDMTLITPLTCPEKRALISSVRERVETVFSQLWSRFVDRVFSRSWNGLWNTIKLKMLHLNLCQAGILAR